MVFLTTKEDLFFPPYPSSLPLPRSPFRSQLETNVILMVTSLEISPLGWPRPGLAGLLGSVQFAADTVEASAKVRPLPGGQIICSSIGDRSIINKQIH